jgi:hypothetical protein
MNKAVNIITNNKKIIIFARMIKRNNIEGQNSLFEDKTQQAKRGQVTPVKEVSSVKSGLKENETRATFILNEDLLEKLKAIAYWERLTIKEVVNTAFQRAIDIYERNNGEIKRPL